MQKKNYQQTVYDDIREEHLQQRPIPFRGSCMQCSDLIVKSFLPTTIHHWNGFEGGS